MLDFYHNYILQRLDAEVSYFYNELLSLERKIEEIYDDKNNFVKGPLEL